MGFLGRFLSSYSESFAAALIAWPFASFALTLPILVILYHRDGRIGALSAAGAYLSVLYLLGLVCFTLYPLPEGDSGPGITYGLDPIWNPLHFIDDIAADGAPAAAQLVANVALFVPFGFIAGRGMRLGAPASAALGFLASLCIELAQLTGLFSVYPYAYRTFETTDLATNTLGALCGWLLARASLRVLPDPGRLAPAAVTASPGIVRRTVAFLHRHGARRDGVRHRRIRAAACALRSGRASGFRRLAARLGAAGNRGGARGRGRRPLAPRRADPGRRVRAHDVRDARAPGGSPGCVLCRADVRDPVRGWPAGHRAPPDPSSACVPRVLPLQTEDALRPDRDGSRIEDSALLRLGPLAVAGLRIMSCIRLGYFVLFAASWRQTQTNVLFSMVKSIELKGKMIITFDVNNERRYYDFVVQGQGLRTIRRRLSRGAFRRI